MLKSDCHNSYVQSRWYRAPEVMLGNKWDHKIDVWSLGALLAELVLGVAPVHRQYSAAVAKVENRLDTAGYIVG